MKDRWDEIYPNSSNPLRSATKICILIQEMAKRPDGGVHGEPPPPAVRDALRLRELTRESDWYVTDARRNAYDRRATRMLIPFLPTENRHEFLKDRAAMVRANTPDRVQAADELMVAISDEYTLTFENEASESDQESDQESDLESNDQSHIEETDQEDEPETELESGYESAIESENDQ